MEPVRVEVGSLAADVQELQDWKVGHYGSLPTGALLRLTAHSLSARAEPAMARRQAALLTTECAAEAKVVAAPASVPRLASSAASALAPGVNPPPGLPPPPGVLSHGSLLHGSGNCRPCMWFWKSAGCEKAEDCFHCHICPASELGARRKRLKQRARWGANKVDCPDAAELNKPASLYLLACQASECLLAPHGSDQETSLGSDVESVSSFGPTWSTQSRQTSRQASTSPRPRGGGVHDAVSPMYRASLSTTSSRQPSPHMPLPSAAAAPPHGIFGATPGFRVRERRAEPCQPVR